MMKKTINKTYNTQPHPYILTYTSTNYQYFVIVSILLNDWNYFQFKAIQTLTHIYNNIIIQENYLNHTICLLLLLFTLSIINTLTEFIIIELFIQVLSFIIIIKLMVVCVFVYVCACLPINFVIIFKFESFYKRFCLDEFDFLFFITKN